MPSQFSDRLNFLMNVTNTTNSALARELSFDASYISRIRNGKRGMPLHQPFVNPAAAYLASRVREPFQIQTVEHALHPVGGWPASTESQARLLAGWLADDTATLDEQFDKLFERLAALPHALANAPVPEFSVEPPQNAVALTASSRYFIGDQGKRDAVELLLTELIATGKPQTLLVYSDENLDWFIGYPTFLRRWTSLMMQLLKVGSSVTVVHTITRDLADMIDAVNNWLPLYLTGGVTSYYCPRIRDGICRRTLIVARGSAAVSANSIENATEGMSSAIVVEPAIVGAYEQEFNNLLQLCRPLVSVAPCSEGLTDEAHNATFIATSANADERLANLGLPMQLSKRLPENAAAFVDEGTGFTLVHLAEPPLAMHVTERLLAAAFIEYVR